jgi:hypothetical protein
MAQVRSAMHHAVWTAGAARGTMAAVRPASNDARAFRIPFSRWWRAGTRTIQAAIDMRLETRLNLIVTACLLLGLSVSGAVYYKLQVTQAEDALLHDASLMLAYGQAVRSYTIEEVGPALAHHSADTFFPQTVPSYAAHTTIEKLRARFPEYSYREVALNPTNSSDRGNGWEVGIVQTFRDFPDKEQLSGQHAGGTTLNYFLAQPIRITDDACLACHSDPELAPKPMIRIYGASNGFGWKLNEVVGARIVTVPAHIALRTVNNSLAYMLVSLSCIFLLTQVVFHFVFRRYVTRPLELITESTELASLNKAAPEDVDAKLVGQMSSLQAAIRRLRRSLTKALSMIDKDD